MEGENRRKYYETKVSYAGQRAVLADTDPEDHIFRTVSKSKQFYERDLLNYIYHSAMPDWIFVDIGAHIGNHSIFFGSILGLKGYAFEANSETFTTLKHNIEKNSLINRIEFYNKSVGSKNGSGSIIKPKKEHNSGMSKFCETSQGEVTMVALDSLQLPKLDLLKIDVEGFEMNCLLGATSTLVRTSPLLVLEIIQSDDFFEIRDWLQPYGYRPVKRFNYTPTYVFSPT
ncbi:FkbM family methyltransferase [Flexibacterium corallicola]|uniref:FkbM family methyltransferase n=1 Tax=Flexibacterium corallicola TaxID=3037259 RepID=UPI00286F2737|nr:FkbM family methyltransferase [Pseudovibrio sp. M1P-2-3]